MTDFKNTIQYVAQLAFDAAPDTRAEAGANFNPDRMCHACRQEIAGEPKTVGNVTSILANCRRWNGCVVCHFCGVAMFDLIREKEAAGRGTPDCPECGAVWFITASRFMNYVDDRAGHARDLFVQWHQKMRCLDVFAVAAGLAVVIAREEGDPLAEDDVENLLNSALDAARLPKGDECINRFFDRLQETLREARQWVAPRRTPLRAVTNSEPAGL